MSAATPPLGKERINKRDNKTGGVLLRQVLNRSKQARKRRVCRRIVFTIEREVKSLGNLKRYKSTRTCGSEKINGLCGRRSSEQTVEKRKSTLVNKCNLKKVQAVASCNMSVMDLRVMYFSLSGFHNTVK